jgi:hypothetical protein
MYSSRQLSKNLKLWRALALLGMEAQEVIFLRMLKLAAGGPKAETETRRMVSEKVDAGTEIARKMMTGVSPLKVTSGLRRKVRANAKRLRR